MDQRYQLENGLRVILREQHASPVVAFQAWVGVGSADEPDELAGVAHVFEHMLFKGTARRGVGKIAQEVESAGGDINAWTSFDQTVYHLVLASRWFDAGLDILSDALRNSSFDPEELGRELKVVLEEIKQGEDNPGRVVTQRLFGAAYTRHEYRRPVIGYVHTVEKFHRKLLLDFFRRHYVPNNITLVVVGDFDPERAKKQIAAAWSDARSRPLPAGGRAPEPAQRRARVVVGGGEVSEAHVVAGFHIPALRHDDTGALDCASIILGQGESSRLHIEVKRNSRKVTDAYAYSFTPEDPGLMVIGATLPVADLDDAVEALLAQAYRMAREEVGVEELAKAQTIIESDAIYQKETVQGMARKLGFYETAATLAFEEEYYRQTRAVTPASLREAVARHLVPENATLSVLLPQADARGQEKKIAARLQARMTKAAEAAGIATPTKKPSTARPAQKRKEETVEAPPVVTATLANGTRVLVLRDPSVPLLAMRAVWVGGLRDEEPADNGINNLISALLTRGTTGRTGEQIAHEIESIAGSMGGFSGRNSFGLRAELLSRHLERGLEIFADCLLDPIFSDEELDHERRQVLEEIRTQEDNASSEAFRLFTRTLYARHPYRLDMIGTRESVTALDRGRLQQFYRGHYAPSQLVLAVAGDVDPEQIVGFVDRCIDARAGAAPRHAGGQRDLREPLPSEPRRVSRALNKQQAHLVVGFPGTTVGDPDRFALEVMSTILSGQGGRLFVELREKKGLAYRVSAFTLEGIDPGYVAVYIACSPENLGVAEEGIHRELRRLVEKPVPAAELARVKRYLAGSHDISLQRRSALASTLAFNEAYGLGWDQHRRYSPAILAVTAEDVHRVARTYLDARRSVTSIVKPDEATTEGAADRATTGARAARSPGRAGTKGRTR